MPARKPTALEGLTEKRTSFLGLGLATLAAAALVSAAPASAMTCTYGALGHTDPRRLPGERR